jgi:hypothetical protein
MILVGITGGLGNQMFQYAFGRALAVKTNLPVRYDISTYKKYYDPSRSFQLQHFNIKHWIASASEIKYFNHPQSYFPSSKAERLFLRIRDYVKPPRLFYENALSFDDHVFNVADNTYLLGYWQSERYFSAAAAPLCTEFTLAEPLDGLNQELVARMQNGNSVSIHVRRGDYVTHPTISKQHGTLPLSYYHNAVAYIASKVTNPVFYVFSDDLDWSRRNVKPPFPVHYVGHNGGEKSYLDLVLISSCKHNIIANSTFSWWGAYLNGNEEKIVIAPQQWFQEQSYKTESLIPERWIKM